MAAPIITFTTDFGVGSPYIAEMKGTALTICPEARLFDISHAVPPQSIDAGAFVLAQAAFSFPPGTIHVAVVDPGVGTERRIIAASVEGHLFVAPDNGLLSHVFRGKSVEKIVHVNRDQYWLPEVSATFHGRDIMTPVAAHLANGVGLEDLGPPTRNTESIGRADLIDYVPTCTGAVIYIDSFGNAITNFPAANLGDRRISRVVYGKQVIDRLVRTYGEASAGDIVALFGSSELLEIAEVGGNAATRLGIEAGTPIEVVFAES